LNQVKEEKMRGFQSKEEVANFLVLSSSIWSTDNWIRGAELMNTVMLENFLKLLQFLDAHGCLQTAESILSSAEDFLCRKPSRLFSCLELL